MLEYLHGAPQLACEDSHQIHSHGILVLNVKAFWQSDTVILYREDRRPFVQSSFRSRCFRQVAKASPDGAGAAVRKCVLQHVCQQFIHNQAKWNGLRDIENNVVSVDLQVDLAGAHVVKGEQAPDQLVHVRS